MVYTSIAIIYNPNSTGASEKLAKELQAEIQEALLGDMMDEAEKRNC